MDLNLAAPETTWGTTNTTRLGTKVRWSHDGTMTESLQNHNRTQQTQPDHGTLEPSQGTTNFICYWRIFATANIEN